MKRSAVLVIVLIAGMFVWMGYNAMVAAWTGPAYETPLTPLPQVQSQTYPSFDVQVHSRGPASTWGGWPDPMQAQHGANCEPPPATHTVQSNTSSVFICAGHVMTAANGEEYGEVVLAPSQLLDCSASCTVQFDLSTERMSTRDWWAVTLSPWADNLTLPFDLGGVDLQGPPRNGLTVSGQEGVGVSLYANGTSSGYFPNFTSTLGTGVVAGTNQAAVRQTFKLTLTSGHLKFERLASATAPALVFHDVDAPVQMLSDYVVQFEHHSYTPTKTNPPEVGVPATWHWSGFTLNPTVPFTLIHTNVGMQTDGSYTLLRQAGTISWSTPAPANAYLRFSGICGVMTDAAVQGTLALAPKQLFGGFREHFASYFVPIQAGRTSVNVLFVADDWYPMSAGCAVQDAAIWSKGGTPISTPTPLPNNSPTPLPPTPTLTSIPPTATSTSVVPTPISTATTVPSTSTPTVKQPCTLHWGSPAIEKYGNLTLTECAARGS